MDRLISMRLDTDTLESLEATALQMGLSRSALIRKVLLRFLAQQPSLRAPK